MVLPGGAPGETGAEGGGEAAPGANGKAVCATVPVGTFVPCTGDALDAIGETTPLTGCGAACAAETGVVAFVAIDALPETDGGLGAVPDTAVDAGTPP